MRRGQVVRPRSMCQWIRTDLDVHSARTRALAAFHQPGRTVAVGAPQSTAFPSGVRIIDASVEACGVEAHGIRNAHQDHLAVFQRHEAVVEIGGGDRDVLAEANRVVLVYPGVVARLDALLLEAFKTRAGILVELPTLRAVIAGRGRTIERSLAQAAVEADKMPA